MIFILFFFNVIHLLHQYVVIKTENIGKVKSCNKDDLIYLFNISEDVIQQLYFKTDTTEKVKNYNGT
jgi:hypothetical protein